MQYKTIETSINESSLSDVLVRLTLSLSSGKDFSKNMVKALRIIGRYSHHDRIHIIKIHGDMTYTVEYEWCEEWLLPLADKSRHQHLVYDTLLEQQLCELNYICIDESDSTLNPIARTYLQSQGCQKMLLLPLFECGTQFAFIVFMQCRDTYTSTDDDIKSLINFSSLIASQMHHREVIKQLHHALYRQEKESEVKTILYSHLKQLHAAIIPAWEDMKKDFNTSDSNDKTTLVCTLEEQLLEFDKICRNYL